MQVNISGKETGVFASVVETGIWLNCFPVDMLPSIQNTMENTCMKIGS